MTDGLWGVVPAHSTLRRQGRSQAGKGRAVLRSSQRKLVPDMLVWITQANLTAGNSKVAAKSESPPKGPVILIKAECEASDTGEPCGVIPHAGV